MATGVKSKQKLQPLGNRVVIKPMEREEKTKGGIVIPDTAKKKTQEGEVISVGPGKINNKGNRIAMNLKVGDRVVYASYAGTEIKIDDKELIIMQEDDILAKKS